MKLETKRLILRDITMKDKESLIKNVNNLNVVRYMALVPYPFTKKDADLWIKESKKRIREKPRKAYDFNIQIKSEKGIIGAIGLNRVDGFNGTAELGYWLGEDFWRQGIMSEAIKEVINFCFNKLKLRRINVSASAKNKASNALIKKMGFKFEGMKRKATRVKSTGKIYDSNIYGLLREEWRR